ncbi:MAG: MBL fold metallo-hydrolase [Lachnospiraceae bacterium]|nr:MBL fold metallo-hydrolase [Lachnospiraceae bacterium]
MGNTVKKMVLGPVGTNCYIFSNEDTKEAVVFDPGDRGDKVYEYLKDSGLTLAAVILTHGHFDHITGVPALLRMSKDNGEKPLLYASEDEKNLLSDAILNCSGTAMSYGSDGVTLEADHYLKDGEELEIAGLKIKCIKTPGHTEGSMSFFMEDERMLVAGDTVFEGSVGRTDLPTGSDAELQRSISEKIAVLPEFTYILPGHGPETTIRDEKQYNPWFR